ncbi:MAG: GGDEF domain-containing protein, partial [Fimbriimonadaceae bacterium]
CNRASLRFFEMNEVELLGMPIAIILASRDQRDLLLELLSVSLSSGSEEHFEWHVTLPQGSFAQMNCSVIPIHTQNGISGGVIACIDASKQRLYEQQIEEQLLQMNEYSMEIEQNRWDLEQANQRLEGLARTDGLTGLYNHRYFQDSLARETKLANRGNLPLSMLLLDVDHFKSYNDSFGHPAGDSVLKQIASVLTQAARETDIVARYGGEEFAFILPNTDQEGAMTVAERVRQAVEQAEWPDRVVTASLGVSSFGSLRSPSDLIKAADEALYASKEAGRNFVTHHTQLQTKRAA